MSIGAIQEIFSWLRQYAKTQSADESRWQYRIIPNGCVVVNIQTEEQAGSLAQWARIKGATEVRLEGPNGVSGWTAVIHANHEKVPV